MKCLLCSFTDASASEIEKHINREHFDLTEEHPYPISPSNFNHVKHLESRTQNKLEDIVSPGKDINLSCLENNSVLPLVCPVCDTFTSTSDVKLAEHVESHFSCSTRVSPDVSNDYLIAKKLLEAEEKQLKLNQQKEFDLLQIQYGMNNEGSFKKQSIQSMQKAVVSGELSVSDFYERQVELKMAENYGIDDCSSCIHEILPRIREESQNCLNVAHTYLCSNLDFYGASYGDRGWGCGYRNLQMLLSSLSREKPYSNLLMKSKLILPKTTNTVAMPSISKLQEAIEKAWDLGFDVRGRDQLGGKVCSSTKWIGATEIVALLSSLRFQCQIVDIRRPSANGLHPKMFDWILQYFQKSESFKPPLYLQHQGHSRTVIGVEVLKDGEKLLLILDPGTGRHHMESSRGNQNKTNSLKFLRKTLYAMKSKQYQIATVVGVVNSEEEYQANKVIENFLTVL